MNPVFGIHVGNSSACLAIYKQDDARCCVEVMANNAGDRVTPAIVTITETEIVVGAACKSLITSLWNTTVTANKLKLDPELSVEEPVNGGRHVSTEYRAGELTYVLPLPTRTEYRTPQQIATSIYRNLIEIAATALPPGEPDRDISCVLMLPPYYSDDARVEVCTAARVVGWDVLHIINEPAAAVLGYNLLEEKTPPNSVETVLVYRVGGKTCDATIIEIKHGLVSILESVYSFEVGGNLLVSSLTKYLGEEFYRRYRLDPRESHRSMTKLTLAAENCLHVLSTIESANCFVESLCDGVDFSHTVSRARFESLLFPYLPIFAEPIDNVFSKTHLTPNDIDKVVLCGGPMKIPRLKKYISDIFQDVCTKVVSLPNGLNYDEVMACGAARQAGSIAALFADNFLPYSIEIPELEFPLSVQVEGAECEHIEFPSGHPLPAHRPVNLTSVEAVVTIHFTQVQNPPDSPPVILKGEVKLENLEDPTEISIELDSESGIRVTVPDSANEFKHFQVNLFEQL